MTPFEAFFHVHQDLPRQGPGAPEDVLWALETAGVSAAPRILDAGSGPGADTVTLAEARPDARIVAVDTDPGFVDAARARTEKFGPRVEVACKSYLDVTGPFDFVWCAGAAYFVGFLNALAAWRPMLAEWGAVTFSEPVWVSEPPSEKARAFWAGEGEVRGLGDITAALDGAGWSLEGHRWITGDPWRAYYEPMRARLQSLKVQPQEYAVSTAIAEAEDEIAKWEAAPDEIAYVLLVVRPA